MSNKPIAWYYQVVTEPRYPGDTMLEVCWTEADAEAQRARGYETHELYGNPWHPISEAPRDGTPVHLWDHGRFLADKSWKSHGSLHGQELPPSWDRYDRGRLEPEPTHFMWPWDGPED